MPPEIDPELPIGTPHDGSEASRLAYVEDTLAIVRADLGTGTTVIDIANFEDIHHATSDILALEARLAVIERHLQIDSDDATLA